MATELDYGRAAPLRTERLTEDGDREIGSDARALLDMFKQRKWLFGLITVAGVALAGGLLTVMTPLYTAKTTVLVNTRQAQVVDLEPVLSNPTPNPFLLQSQLESEIEMIRSYPRVAEVVEKLGLVNDPEFNPTLEDPEENQAGALLSDAFLWLKRRAASLSGPDAADPNAPDRYRSLSDGPQSREKQILAMVVANVQDQLEVSARGRSTAIMLAFTSRDPDKATAVVDALAHAYVNSTVNAKTQASRDAIRWLDDRVQEMRGNIADLRENIERYRQQEGLVADEPHNQNLVQVNKDLIEAQIEAKVAQERLDQLHKGGAATAMEVLSSPLIQTLRGNEAALQRQADDLTDRYGARHPMVQANTAALQGLRRKIDAEIGKIQKLRENELVIAQSRVALLKDRLSGLEQESGRRNLAQLRMQELEIEVGAKQRLYEAFLRRRHEVSQQLDIQQPDAQIIAPAMTPIKPSFPRKALFLSCSLLISMILGACTVVAVELLSRGFKTIEDIEQTLHAPMLGMVPRLGRMARLRGRPEAYPLLHPHSLYSEAIRNLRTSLRVLATSPGPNNLLFASALPNEGKTAIALSFARMAARAGQRTIFIDCDLRRPRLHKSVGYDGPGLTDFLEHGVPPEDIIHTDGTSGLNLITAGSGTSRPAELLERPALRELLALLGCTYDLIVLDSPPVLSVADTRLLAQLADETVYVVEWDRTSRKEARLGFNMLRQANARIAGVVLSKAATAGTTKYAYTNGRRIADQSAAYVAAGRGSDGR
ncbi:GumC family protein [Azospirillum sp. sgz302134]